RQRDRGGAVLPCGPGARGRPRPRVGAARRRAELPGPGQAVGGETERRRRLTACGAVARGAGCAGAVADGAGLPVRPPARRGTSACRAAWPLRRPATARLGSNTETR